MSDFEFTEEQISRFLGNNKQAHDWFSACLISFPGFDINTKDRVAHFLSQTSHESNGFTATSENLNYSAQALQKIFGKYFPTEVKAIAYARQPEKIANYVYANRMGNGPEESGDGWKYRGRGLIQLTGKNNYNKYAAATNQTLEDAIEKLNTIPGAVESACWFWKENGLNQLADSGDIIAVTKKINGGINGLDDRTARFKKIMEIFNEGVDYV